MAEQEQIGYVVKTETYVLATDADDASVKVKNGEGSVISRQAAPKPQSPQQPLSRNPAIAALQQSGQVVNMKEALQQPQKVG